MEVSGWIVVIEAMPTTACWLFRRHSETGYDRVHEVVSVGGRLHHNRAQEREQSVNEEWAVSD